MLNFLSVRARQCTIAAAALALGAGMLTALNVRADESTSPMAAMTPMTGDERKMMMSEITKMKAMADQPDQAQKLKAHMAKMMVMDNMAKKMAMDPQSKQSCADAMNDPNIKSIHEEAMQMAADPQEMEKLQKEIATDPVLMKVVLHRAMTMAMMADMHAQSPDTNSKMKTMEDKMKDMGDKAMNGGK